MLDKIYQLNKKIAEGNMSHSEMYRQLFLDRLGSIQSYTDRGETYLTEGYQNNPVVFTIISLIAKLASGAQWTCKDYSGKEIYIPELATLLSRPTVDTSFRDYIQSAVTNKLYSGNTFSAVSRYGDGMPGNLVGKPKELFVLPSNEIQIWLKEGGEFEKYVLDFQGSTRNPERGIDAKNVGHWRNPNPDYSIEGDFLWGQAYLKAASRSLQTYNATLDAGLWYQINKGIESILVNNDADIELGDEVIDSLKSKLRLQAQGPENAGNVPIIDANLGVINLGSTPEDIKLLPLRLQAAREIASVFNFPVKLLGIDDSTYQNAKEANKALWQNAVIPELEEIKDGLNRWLAPMYPEDFYIDYDLNHVDSLQEDKLMRGKAIKEYAGLVTIPMALEMAGLPVYDFMKKEPTSWDEWKEMQYLGFTQAVVSDQEEISNINNNEDKPKQDE